MLSKLSAADFLVPEDGVRFLGFKAHVRCSAWLLGGGYSFANDSHLPIEIFLLDFVNTVGALVEVNINEHIRSDIVLLPVEGFSGGVVVVHDKVNSHRFNRSGGGCASTHFVVRLFFFGFRVVASRYLRRGLYGASMVFITDGRIWWRDTQP